MLDATPLLRILAFLVMAALLSACSTIPKQNIHASAGTLSQKSAAKITQHLYQQYRTWQGTPYAWGGLSRRGVDCSGFVYLTLNEQFGANLPRTTEQQIQTGYPVAADDLQAGDLVFFKTGAKVRHVGIYLEKGTFLHASTSKGVIISHLDNVYWQQHYWHGRRIR